MSTHASPTSSTAGAAGLLVASVGVTLLAQFVLDGFADASTVGHWLQHGLLFAGGIGAGASGLVLHRNGRRLA